MTREEMIEWLVNSDIDFVQNHDGGREWLVGLLWSGFEGYDKNTDEELRQEIMERDPDFIKIFGGQ